MALLDRLLGEAQDALASVRDLTGDERAQVVADFTDTVQSLRMTARPAAAGEGEPKRERTAR